jgi:hypothetical protein
VVSEPEWDRAAVDRLAGRKHYLDGLGDHGQPLDEAIAPESDPSREGGWKYEVEGPFSDHAAAALEAAQKQFYDKPANKDRLRGGDRWRVIKKPKR